MELIPDSGGHIEPEASNLREIGWTDAARDAARASRARNFSTRTAFKKGSGKSDAVIDYYMRDIVGLYGKEAGKHISANLGIRIGVKTKTATSIRSTFFSNDGKTQYAGSIRGMRQKIMSWAKANKKTLPAGFENRSPSAIAGMFSGMARSGYFSSLKSKSSYPNASAVARLAKRGIKSTVGVKYKR